MKILVAGHSPAQRLHRGTCQSCKCEVEFTQGEATYHPGYGPREAAYYSVKCTPEGLSRTSEGYSSGADRRQTNLVERRVRLHAVLKT
jgi:hypothetical protein